MRDTHLRHHRLHGPNPGFASTLRRSGRLLLVLLAAGLLTLISPSAVQADTTANAETERIVALQPGYNLVVYTGPTIEARLLPDLIPELSRIWRWDARAQEFDIFSSTGFSLDRIGSIRSGDALWVTVREASQWRMPVLPLTPFVTLYDGWNLVPWVGDDGLSPEAAFQPTISRLGAAYSWGSEIGAFLAFSPTLLPALNSLERVTQFAGLWVRVTEGPPIPWQQVSGESLATTPLDGAEVTADSQALIDSSAVARSVVLIDSSAAAGSGFVIDGGLIVTAAHVVGDSEWLTVWFSDGQHQRAQVTAPDTDLDIAIAAVTNMPDNAVALDWESAPTPPLAEEVWVWGYPVERTVISAGFSRAQTVTRGIVSAHRIRKDVRSLQIDAAVNAGNSGGPVVTAGGRLVGLVTSILRPGGKDLEGFNFALDITQHRDAIRALLTEAARTG